MSEYKNVVITKTARMKLVKARAGAAALPRVIGMAFGSGGVNADGTVKTPSGSQTALADERYRKRLTSTAFRTKQRAGMNARCSRMNLQTRKSVKSDCMMRTAILSASKILCGKARMMMSNRPTCWTIFFNIRRGGIQ